MSRSSSKFDLRIVIVGGGIAGFSTAIGLNKQGFRNVTVLERHPSSQSLGAPLRLGPNATRVFQAWGIGDELSEMNAHPRHAMIRRYEDGRILLKTDPGDMLKVYGAPLWSISRFKLQEKLAQIAQSLGTEVLWDSRVVEIVDESWDAQPAVELSDGRALKADLIIGADGITSLVREKISGPVESIDSLVLYNLDISISSIERNPKTASLIDEQTLWLGPSSMIAQMLMSDNGNVMNLSLSHEELGNRDHISTAGEWMTQGDLGVLKRVFANFAEAVREMISMAPARSCYVWKLKELPPLKTWRSRKSGRVALLGDAAHAMLPYAGQGAGMGIEDAACLAEFLAQIATLADVPVALERYESLRKPRADWVRCRARSVQMPIYHLADGPAQRERDDAWSKLTQGLASVPTSEAPWTVESLDDAPCAYDDQGHPLATPYLLGYDVIGHTRRSNANSSNARR